GDAAGPVYQHDAGRDLVHVLAALAARVDERFLEIVWAHAETREAFLELAGLVTVERHGAKPNMRLRGGPIAQHLLLRLPREHPARRCPVDGVHPCRRRGRWLRA